MEIAIKYHNAQWGDLQDKIDFVEYFFCNGPELDTNTILYYRSKILVDTTYTEIADYYFNDMDFIDQVREEKYGKKSDDGDCFSKPCQYLGRFSDYLGIQYDVINTQTPQNDLAVAAFISNEWNKVSRAYNEYKKSGKIPQGYKTSDWEGCIVNGELDKDAWTKKWEKDTEDKISAHKRMPIIANIKGHLMHLIVPSFLKSMSAMEAHLQEQQTDHNSDFEQAQMSYVLSACGDPYAHQQTDAISLMGKANMKRKMGDCARLWEWARQWRPFSPVDNAFTTVPPKACNIGGVKIDGQLADSSSNRTVLDSSLSPESSDQTPIAAMKYIRSIESKKNKPLTIEITEWERKVNNESGNATELEVWVAKNATVLKANLGKWRITADKNETINYIDKCSSKKMTREATAYDYEKEDTQSIEEYEEEQRLKFIADAEAEYGEITRKAREEQESTIKSPIIAGGVSINDNNPFKI